MRKPLFIGAGVAIVTPFTENGVDYDKFGELIEFQITEGIDAIVVCGTTGESSTMGDEEHQDVIKYAVDKVAGRVPVIGGAGSNDTNYAIKLSKEAEKLGCDALLHVTPYYNKTSQKGLYEHFKMIANSVNIPIILYNVPSRTGINIDSKTTIELSKIENIIAVKECNFSQVADIVRNCSEDFSVYSGNDNEVLPCLSLGGKGVISVIANIMPKKTKEIVHNYLQGDVKKSTSDYLKTFDLLHALSSDVNPIPVKTALNILNKGVGKCRLPLVETSEENVKLITKALANHGLI